jgi:DNA invertase Pin-like site-specific DNA recombinase
LHDIENDASAGDILLIEQVDRLSRLNESDWAKLKQSLNEKHIKVVALDLPTSWMMAATDETTARMFDAINNPPPARGAGRRESEGRR